MQFNEQHEQLRDTVAKFVANEINPYVDEWEAADQFPSHEVFKKMGDLGLLGLRYPEEFGGAGLDMTYSLVLAEELGMIDCGGVPMAIGVQTDMATPALARLSLWGNSLAALPDRQGLGIKAHGAAVGTLL